MTVLCTAQWSLAVSLFHFSLWSSEQSFLVLLHASLPCQLQIWHADKIARTMEP